VAGEFKLLQTLKELLGDAETLGACQRAAKDAFSIMSHGVVNRVWNLVCRFAIDFRIDTWNSWFSRALRVLQGLWGGEMHMKTTAPLNATCWCLWWPVEWWRRTWTSNKAPTLTWTEQYRLVVYSACSSQKLKYIWINSSGLPVILLFTCGVGDIFFGVFFSASQQMMFCSPCSFLKSPLSRLREFQGRCQI